MPARYSSVQRVADHLGRDLTGVAVLEADRALRAAEAWIDARTGRPWSAGAVTELRVLSGANGLLLERPPVASVATVELRSPYIGAVWQPLTPSAYELVDPDTGLLLLSPAYVGWWARVVYTPAPVPDGGVDPRIARAATLLAAHWLRPTLEASSGGAVAGPVVARRVGDVEVRYAEEDGATASTATTTSGSIPEEVETLLGSLGAAVVLA